MIWCLVILGLLFYVGIVAVVMTTIATGDVPHDGKVESDKKIDRKGFGFGGI